MSKIRDAQVELASVPTYQQCAWASESYLRIQHESKLTFEAIFLFLPLGKMYASFDAYHEMDFSRIVEEFQRRFLLDSALGLLLDRYGCSLMDVSKATKIAYDVLYSVKKRRHSVQSMNVAATYAIAAFFRVRIETIAELKII